MRIDCPSCAAIYDVPAILFEGGPRALRCASCGLSWTPVGHGAVAAKMQPKVVASDLRANEQIAQPPVQPPAQAVAGPEPQAGPPAQAKVEVPDAPMDDDLAELIAGLTSADTAEPGASVAAPPPDVAQPPDAPIADAAKPAVEGPPETPTEPPDRAVEKPGAAIAAFDMPAIPKHPRMDEPAEMETYISAAAMASVAAAPRPSFALTLAWFATLGGVGALVVAFLLFPQVVVDQWPAATRLYHAVGFVVSAG